MSIVFLTDKICLKHRSGFDHPEKPSRISKTNTYLEKKAFKIESSISSYKSLPGDPILNEVINKVHSSQIITALQSSQNRKYTMFNFDCIANNFTYLASMSSAKLTLDASIKASPYKTFFSLIRPPGHHATKNEMMGFCYLNNIAIASLYQHLKKKRVVIFDFDFHYGNGTADIFLNNPEVLYISIHADPAYNYPNSGFISELGKGDGKGYNVCIPLSFGAGDKELVYCLRKIVLPLLREFKPDILGISAGFDGYYNDPVGLGFLKYTKHGFQSIGKIIHDYSIENKIPVYHALEGGYDISNLSHLINSYISPWKQRNQGPFKEKISLSQKTKNQVKKKEIHTISNLSQLLKEYWNI